MELRTTFRVPPFDFNITYDDKLFFLGSCFAENISSYFEKYKFKVFKNPFGILYNPRAIEKIIHIASDNTYEPAENSFEHKTVWSNFDAHSSLSNPDKIQHFKNLKNARLRTLETLENSHVIFISLGTAWLYKHIASQKYVANCHKLPNKNFQKELLDLESTKLILRNIVKKISTINKDAKIVFTLSPVRHLKDGFVENQQSKSILHIAIQESLDLNNNVYYFPSYEILLDDLRDYRFYTSDYLHPNKLALDYIWENITTVFFTEKTRQHSSHVDKINKRLSHHLFNPESKDSKAFKAKTQELIKELNKRYPHIIF